VSVDLSRVASAAVAAALDDGKPRRRGLSSIRAVVLGAALGTAARVAVARAPVPDFARLPDLVRDRLADRGLLPDDEESDDFPEGDEHAPEAQASDEEPAADAEPQSEEEEPQSEEEEPQAEEEEPQGDEEPQADEEEEPQAEEEEPQAEEEEEPQAEEEPEPEEPEADSEGADTPDLLGALSGGRRRVRPARRPPKAPKSAEAGS
jgi:outer membrane biosynthesis protein TonB